LFWGLIFLPQPLERRSEVGANPLPSKPNAR
jgi:hypothetical protein